MVGKAAAFGDRGKLRLSVRNREERLLFANKMRQNVMDVNAVSEFMLLVRFICTSLGVV